MKINKHSSIPLYCQLKGLILEKIDQGIYPTGSKIPSENELCSEFKLSRPTVRQAISELVSEGKLQIQKGKGTYVTASDLSIIIDDFSGFSYSFFSHKEVSKDSFESYQHLMNEDIKPVITGFFDNVDKSKGFYKIKKVLSKNNVIYAFTESYIPAAIFPGLIEDIESNKNMVDITVNKYAYLPSRTGCSIYVSKSGPDSSETLDIARGTPVLTVISVLKSRSEAISEVIVLKMRTDICKLKL